MSLCHDPALVDAELLRLIYDDPLVRKVHMVIGEFDPDQIHALKATIILLAAQKQDLIDELRHAQAMRPLIIEMPTSK